MNPKEENTWSISEVKYRFFQTPGRAEMELILHCLLSLAQSPRTQALPQFWIQWDTGVNTTLAPSFPARSKWRATTGDVLLAKFVRGGSLVPEEVGVFSALLLFHFTSFVRKYSPWKTCREKKMVKKKWTLTTRVKKLWWEREPQRSSIKTVVPKHSLNSEGWVVVPLVLEQGGNWRATKISFRRKIVWGRYLKAEVARRAQTTADGHRDGNITHRNHGR